MIKMRAYVLVLLFGLLCGYCAGRITSTNDETSTKLPTIISETEIERNASGYCTFELK